MEVILLERVEKLGQMGDVVRVRDGFARNFLLPTKRALRATEANRKRYEVEREQLEARNAERRAEASTVGEVLDGKSFVVIRQAGESGQLYGSVSTRDIADVVRGAGFLVDRAMVVLQSAIKTLGLHEVVIALHAEVRVTITLNIARSEDEAALQAEGVDVIAREAEEDAAERAEMFADVGAAAADDDDDDHARDDDSRDRDRD